MGKAEQAARGSVVEYRLSKADVGRILKRRARETFLFLSDVSEGAACPMLVVNVRGRALVTGIVVLLVWKRKARYFVLDVLCGRVCLHSLDTLLVKAVPYGEGPGQWCWPEIRLEAV